MKRSRRDIIKISAAGLTVGSLLSIELNEGTSVKEFMGRATARYVLNPREYLEPKATEDIGIRPFSLDFTHEFDEMNGLYDTVSDVSETVEKQRGDCVDHSAVAASWLLQHTNRRPYVVAYAPLGVDYGHINVYDGGAIYDYTGVYKGKDPETYARMKDMKVLYKSQV